MNNFTFEIKGDGAATSLELTNASDETLKSVEILTIFLKDEVTPGGGPSKAHIRFEPITSVRPKETVVLPHKTWVDGKAALATDNELQRLRVVAGSVRPYVLDISWQNGEGKACFQRIPVGH